MKLAIGDLKFDERGLIPAVVQDARTREVLTLGYMNAESLERTLREKETWFWSRSRARLWHKGETSGHTQRVVEVRLDCDGDALVALVEPAGPACHTGARTCFHHEVAEFGGRAGGSGGSDAEGGDRLMARAADESEDGGGNGGGGDLGDLLDRLYTLIGARKRELPEGSYTTYLFTEGLDKILKKVGEESAETIIAAKNDDPRAVSSEVSDLIYHLLVLLVERGVTLADVHAELARRAEKPRGEQ